MSTPAQDYLAVVTKLAAANDRIATLEAQLSQVTDAANRMLLFLNGDCSGHEVGCLCKRCQAVAQYLTSRAALAALEQP